MKLNELLPYYYGKNQTMKLLQEILSEETETLERTYDKVTSECFLKTASSQLSRYEQIFGLEVRPQQSDRYRRERIYAKIAGNGTTTKEMLERIARNFSNGDVEIREDHEHYQFTVKFVGTMGIPGNMDGLKATIEEIKPAHLEVIYEYMYNTWASAGRFTWKAATAHTWETMKVVSSDE